MCPTFCVGDFFCTCRVWCQVSGLGFRVSHFVCRVFFLTCRVLFQVSGLGFRVSHFMCIFLHVGFGFSFQV